MSSNECRLCYYILAETTKMALVAYDASSSDESEGEELETTSKVIIPNGANKNKVENVSSRSSTIPVASVNTDVNTENSNDLFTALPQPKHQNSGEIIEEEDEFLLKKAVPEEPKPEKKRQPVKISIPSLAEFRDDEDDEPKPKKACPAPKGSGLFAILPPPKTTPITTKSFVPNVLTKKTKAAPTPLVPRSVKAAKPKTAEALKADADKDHQTDDSDDDIEIPETFDEETWLKVCGQQKAVRKPIIEEVLPDTSNQIEIAPEPVKPYSGLDNEGFKQLVGKMRKKPENFEMIEINEDDILPDKDTWMIKSLTDPNHAPKYVEKDPVNDTCKRKHHITYLAQQAKANELDLQNQWSANKFSRQQTRNKYGF